MTWTQGARTIVLGVVLVLVGGACQAQAPTSQPTGAGSEKPLTIYYVGISGPDNSFFAIIIKGAEDAGRQVGVTLKYVFPTVGNVQGMIDLTDQAIAAKADGIAMNILDSAVQIPAAKRAVAAGIVVAAGDAVPDQRSPDDPFIVYAGSNELLAGQRAAERMLSVRTPKHAVCAIHAAGSQALETRCAGFQKPMDAAGVKVDKLAIDGSNPTQATESLRAFFTANPDADALMTLGPQGANPGLSFLQDVQAKDILFGAFDLDPAVLQGIKDGKILFTIDQQPYLRGYIPVMTLALNLRYAFRPANDYLTGPSFVDTSNVDSVIALNKQGIR